MRTPEHIDLTARREIIRSNLTEIAADIGMVMRDAGLGFLVFPTFALTDIHW